MNPLNQRLRQTFFFSASDLRANRSGQFSPRQQARLQASGASIGLSLIVFTLVMLGTIGVSVVISLASGATPDLTNNESRTTILVLAGVIGLVIVYGYFSSRKHIAATRAKTFKVAEGVAQVGKIRADAAHFEIKIGRNRLRLPAQEQFDAFEPGTAYRIYFVPGPIPTILSGEIIGTEAEADLPDDPEAPLEQDVILRRHQAGRPVVIVLALLALGIPLVGVAASTLPGGLRALVMFGLLAAAILFVFWALRRMSK
jgi:hypothetical protein